MKKACLTEFLQFRNSVTLYWIFCCRYYVFTEMNCLMALWCVFCITLLYMYYIYIIIYVLILHTNNFEMGNGCKEGNKLKQETFKGINKRIMHLSPGEKWLFIWFLSSFIIRLHFDRKKGFWCCQKHFPNANIWLKDDWK